jgi:hypothetical protein
MHHQEVATPESAGGLASGAQSATRGNTRVTAVGVIPSAAPGAQGALDQERTSPPPQTVGGPTGSSRETFAGYSPWGCRSQSSSSDRPSGASDSAETSLRLRSALRIWTGPTAFGSTVSRPLLPRRGNQCDGFGDLVDPRVSNATSKDRSEAAAIRQHSGV